MDERLVGWGRAVKARRRHVAGGVPPLWLFSDERLGADLVAAVRRLPAGLCGVVFRHDGLARAQRAALARAVALVCRQRRLVLTVAGRGTGIRCGRHLRGGRGVRRGGVCTASAHGVADLVRGRGVSGIFLSPVFATASHGGARGLGVVRWAGMARRCDGSVLALGGVDGRSVRRLPRWVAGAGAIGAWLG